VTAPVILVAHTANVSGAEKMLLSVLGEARRAGRPVTVLCPSGALADVSGDVEAITGRRPLSFREFLTVG